MPSPTVDISTGFSITFGTSGFTAEIVDVTPPAVEREAIDVSHQGTTDRMAFLPSDLADSGELEFTIHFNPDTDPPIDADPEQVTIDFPSGAKWAFTGFMTTYQPSAPLGEKMTATVRVKGSGDITITPAP